MRLKYAAMALSAALALGVGGQASAVTVDLASTFPKDMIFLGDGPKYFAKTLEEISKGDVKVKIHGAGDLVPALEVLNAVSSGAVAASYDWEGYWGGVVPVANLVGSLPFGPQPEVLAGWIWEGGGREIVQKAYDKLNVVSLPCVVVPAEPAGWYNKEIKTVEDLNGLKMRIGGLAARAMTKLGVSTQIIPGGEVFVALERGRIDAAEFSLPSVDQSIQLQKAAKYYYFPGWHQPSSINSIKFNKGVWEKFSDVQRQQIETACRSSFLWTLTNGIPDQIKVLQDMEANGTQVGRLPEPVVEALRKATDEVIAEERQKDPIFDEAYESLSAYMKAVDRWNTLQSTK